MSRLVIHHVIVDNKIPVYLWKTVCGQHVNDVAGHCTDYRQVTCPDCVERFKTKQPKRNKT